MKRVIYSAQRRVLLRLTPSQAKGRAHEKFIDASNCVAYCVAMATNLAIDDQLLTEAKRLGHFPSKKETVNSALREFIERRKQKEIVKLFGTVDYDADYDYKKLRDRKPKKR